MAKISRTNLVFLRIFIFEVRADTNKKYGRMYNEKQWHKKEKEILHRKQGQRDHRLFRRFELARIRPNKASMYKPSRPDGWL